MKKISALLFLFVFIASCASVPTREPDTILQPGGFGKAVLFGPFGRISVDNKAKEMGTEYCKSHGGGTPKVQGMFGPDMKYRLWCVKDGENGETNPT